MSTAWFYVDGQERIGPLEEPQLVELIKIGTLGGSSFVWRKGFEQWRKLEDVDELQAHLESAAQVEQLEVDDHAEADYDFPDIDFSWENVKSDEQIFSIKIGKDRGGEESEFGPFTLDMIRQMWQERRINAKTYIFAPGMQDWILLGDVPTFQDIFSEVPPVIQEEDRRQNVRKPFVARLLFHDDSQVFEGLCRDVSVGGMQVLVSGYPGKIGDRISLNVHPDNTNFHFTASGQIVRFLNGNQGFSFRFTDLSDDAKNAIQTFVQN